MSIATVAVVALKVKAIEAIVNATKDFFQKDVPEIVKKFEDELNAELAKIRPGDKFLSLTVVDVDGDYFYPLVRFENIDAKIVSGLKIDLIRATLKVRRHINLTDSSQPPIEIDNNIPAYAFYITLERPGYGMGIGGGDDNILQFSQMHVAVRWDAVPLRLEGFYAEADHGGFIITVRADLPFPIPLANTGLGLCGVGLTYGERFAPRLTEAAVDPIEEMRKATAQQFVDWARKRPDEQWVPSKVDVRVFGLRADIGDVTSAGHIIRFDQAGLTYISAGPTIVFGGSLVLLNTLKLAETIGAIDVPSQSTFLSSTVNFEVADLLRIAGRLEYSASLKDQTKTWVAVGGYNMDGSRLEILKLFELWGGQRLVPLQGYALRAGARVKGEGKLLGFGGGYSFGLEVQGSVGWNPIELGGSLAVDGYVWIEIFGRQLGVGADANLSLRLPKPLELKFSVTVTFKIWFAKFSKTVTIFNLKDTDILRAAAALMLAVGGPISFIHRANGALGVINSPDAAINPNNEVPPDFSFDLPFQRLAGGVAIATNAATGDGVHREGGIDVQHLVKEIRICAVDESTGAEIDVPNVRAAWLAVSGGEQHRRSTRLAIPCADPLAWLQSFEYSSPGSSQPQLDTVFQTFGAGPNETIPQPAIFDLGRLRIASNKAIQIQNLNRIKPYERGVIALVLTLTVGADQHAPNDLLAVRNYDLRFIGRSDQEPSIGCTNGTISFTRVRQLDKHSVEWAGRVERTVGEQKLPVMLVSHDEWPFTLAAVGYVVDWSADTEGAEETVLRPGLYKLYLDGQTTTSFKGRAGPVTDWRRRAETFRVVAPKDLRPYWRYATNGDERIFGMPGLGWNPNPSGIGFGHYRSHVGVTRARVGYLSKIFPSLWVSPSAEITPAEVKVTQCTDGTIAGSKLSQEWQTTYNVPQMLEEEILYDAPLESGMHQMVIQAKRDLSGKLETVDEWSYRVSKFDRPTEHLRPIEDRLIRVYGPFGLRSVSSKVVTVPPETLTGIPDAKLVGGWALPSWMQSEIGLTHNAGLVFLRIAEQCGVFAADPLPFAERLVKPARRTELCLLGDHDERPVGFLWRTPEPVDWRRVELELFHWTTDSLDRRFSVKLTPSGDGTSCLVTLLAENVAVRIPAGGLALRLKFNYVVDRLPTLVDRNDTSLKQEELLLAFTQPVGALWPAR